MAADSLVETRLGGTGFCRTADGAFRCLHPFGCTVPWLKPEIMCRRSGSRWLDWALSAQKASSKAYSKAKPVCESSTPSLYVPMEEHANWACSDLWKRLLETTYDSKRPTAKSVNRG